MNDTERLTDFFISNFDIKSIDELVSFKQTMNDAIDNCIKKMKEPKDTVKGNPFSADELDDNFDKIKIGDEFYLYYKKHNEHVWQKASDKLIRLKASTSLMTVNFLIVHQDFYTERMSSMLARISQALNVHPSDIDIKFHIHNHKEGI